MHRLEVAMSEQSSRRYRGVLQLVQLEGAGTLWPKGSHASGEQLRRSREVCGA